MEQVLEHERAEYGKQVIENLSKDLSASFGKGWNTKQLMHCVRFAQIYPDLAIVSAVRRQLSWTRIKPLIYIDDPLKRNFYPEMCQQEGCSPRPMQDRLG